MGPFDRQRAHLDFVPLRSGLRLALVSSIIWLGYHRPGPSQMPFWRRAGTSKPAKGPPVLKPERSGGPPGVARGEMVSRKVHADGFAKPYISYRSPLRLSLATLLSYANRRGGLWLLLGSPTSRSEEADHLKARRKDVRCALTNLITTNAKIFDFI